MADISPAAAMTGRSQQLLLLDATLGTRPDLRRTYPRQEALHLTLQMATFSRERLRG